MLGENLWTGLHTWKLRAHYPQAGHPSPDTAPLLNTPLHGRPDASTARRTAMLALLGRLLPTNPHFYYYYYLITL
jgi:hypothetical protein